MHVFTNAIVRTPGPDAAEGLTTSSLGRPVLSKLVEQHATYVQTLKDLGLTISHLDPLPGHPDAYFVEDTALLFPELAVITRPGALARRAEATAIADTVAQFRLTFRVNEPATLDGGDVLLIGQKVFVGLSERTNAEGARQLANILAPWNYEVVRVAVPSGLHLKSSVTWAGDDVLVVTGALAPKFPGFRHLLVPADEEYAANVLWINGTVLMPKGFPRTQTMLSALGPVLVLDQSEVQKMDGALTCMSLRF
jgi:dimethylargininase